MLRVEQVAHVYGDTTALAGVSLDVQRGETVALVGPSGCGKTTLLQIAGGLLTPVSGSVSIDGCSPAEARTRCMIGWVPQSPALLPWRNVADNVSVLCQVAAASAPPARPVRDLLASVGLSEFADALPHELSGGMQQRAALARALSLGARYLLLDEPFGALDEITRAEMRHLLAELCGAVDAGVLLVTHSLDEAVYLADRVFVMSGRPGTMAGEVDIALPRPRHPALEDVSEFSALRTQVRSVLHQHHGGMTT